MNELTKTFIIIQFAHVTIREGDLI